MDPVGGGRGRGQAGEDGGGDPRVRKHAASCRGGPRPPRLFPPRGAGAPSPPSPAWRSGPGQRRARGRRRCRRFFRKNSRFFWSGARPPRPPPAVPGGSPAGPQTKPPAHASAGRKRGTAPNRVSAQRKRSLGNQPAFAGRGRTGLPDAKRRAFECEANSQVVPMTSSSGPARSEVDEATVATLRAKIVVVGKPPPPPPAPGEPPAARGGHPRGREGSERGGGEHLSRSGTQEQDQPAASLPLAPCAPAPLPPCIPPFPGLLPPAAGPGGPSTSAGPARRAADARARQGTRRWGRRRWCRCMPRRGRRS